VRDMIYLAEATLRAALQRNESRGAHYKPAFPDRNDAEYLKTSVVSFDAATESATVSYEAIDTSLVTPRARTYGKKDPAAKPAETARVAVAAV